jgi:hypothetical protein
MSTFENSSAVDDCKVVGEPPWLGNLALVMDPAPALLDRLASEFLPAGDALATPSAWWLAFHTFVVDKLVGEEMSGASRESLREAVWAIYATGYWGMLEMQVNFGVPPAVINLGMEAAAPSADSVADLAAKLAQRHALLEAGGTALLEALPTLLREEPCTGTLHGAAYNTGYVEVISEYAPLGELPSELQAGTGSIRANARDFLRIDYAMRAPAWLQQWRRAFEISARGCPGALDRIALGEGGAKDLRTIWTEALDWGHNNWGGQSLDQWSQAYFDDCLEWSIVFNFGLEAVMLATFVALIDEDVEAAERAVRGNALYLGSWGAAVMGLLDTGGTLPEIARG